MPKLHLVLSLATLAAVVTVGVCGETSYSDYKIDPSVGNATVRRCTLDIVTFKNAQEFLKAIEDFAPKLGSHVYLFLGRNDQHYYAATQLSDPPSLIRIDRNAVAERDIIAALSRINRVEAEWKDRTAVVKAWPEAFMFTLSIRLDAIPLGKGATGRQSDGP